MPLKRHHLPAAVPIVVAIAAIGIIVGVRSLDLFGLSEGFWGTALIALAGVIALGLVLDLVLISHRDRHRY